MEGKYTIVLLPDGKLGEMIAQIRDDLSDITRRPKKKWYYLTRY